MAEGIGTLAITRPVVDVFVKNVGPTLLRFIGFTEENTTFWDNSDRVRIFEVVMGCRNIDALQTELETQIGKEKLLELIGTDYPDRVAAVIQEIRERSIPVVSASAQGGSVNNMVVDAKILDQNQKIHVLYPYASRPEDIPYTGIVLDAMNRCGSPVAYYSDQIPRERPYEVIYAIEGEIRPGHPERFFLSSDPEAYPEFNEQKTRKLLTGYGEILVEGYAYAANPDFMNSLIGVATLMGKRTTFALSNNGIALSNREPLLGRIENDRISRIVGSCGEIEALFGGEGYKAYVQNPSAFLKANYPHLEVFETLGAEGIRFCTATQTYTTRAITPTRELHPTGAGDAAYGGFMTGLALRPEDYQYALHLAASTARHVLGRPEANLSAIIPADRRRIFRNAQLLDFKPAQPTAPVAATLTTSQAPENSTVTVDQTPLPTTPTLNPAPTSWVDRHPADDKQNTGRTPPSNGRDNGR